MGFIFFFYRHSEEAVAGPLDRLRDGGGGRDHPAAGQGPLHRHTLSYLSINQPIIPQTLSINLLTNLPNILFYWSTTQLTNHPCTIINQPFDKNLH